MSTPPSTSLYEHPSSPRSLLSFTPNQPIPPDTPPQRWKLDRRPVWESLVPRTASSSTPTAMSPPEAVPLTVDGTTTKPRKVPKRAKRNKQQLDRKLRHWLRKGGPTSPCIRKSHVQLKIKTSTTTTTTIIPAIAPENDYADEAYLRGPRQSLGSRFSVGSPKKPWTWTAPLEVSKDTATRVSKIAAVKKEEEQRRSAIGSMRVMKRRVV